MSRDRWEELLAVIAGRVPPDEAWKAGVAIGKRSAGAFRAALRRGTK